MTDDGVAHRALQYLLRSTGTPEITTNNLLQALLDEDTMLRAAFLEELSQLTGVDLRDCRVEREAYRSDATGKRSFRDFLISSGTNTRAIVETKIDSALTSEDQVTRYLDQLDEGGALILVTRQPLVRGLAVQASGQLGNTLPIRNGVHRTALRGREVLVLSWGRLLRAIVDPAGKPFPDLVALAAAIEELPAFVPFTPLIQDIAVGQAVTQIVDVAYELCAALPARLEEAGVDYDWISRTQKWGRAVWVSLAILGHEIWVGYDSEHWSRTPGDPLHPETGGPTAAFPSPFWVSRHADEPRRAVKEVELRRRARLDGLGVALPLQAPLGTSFDAVLESLLDQAVRHIAGLSTALHADPQALAEFRAADTQELAPQDEELGELIPGSRRRSK